MPMKKTSRYIFYIFGMLMATLVAIAQETKDEFVLGKHYQAVVPAQPVQTAGKIEVLEIFWYGCPHCYDFEPPLNRWLSTKPPDIEFQRMPAVFRPDWALHAKTYYTAEALGVIDKIHTPLFKAIHEDKRKLNDEASLAEFFSEQGVSKEEFSTSFNSFTVESKTRQARHMVRQYGIGGVPAIVVNGKYHTSATLTGNYEQLLKVIDYLADKERQELARAR
jgi:thiol:disulfide interchange protein DsbA